MVLTRPLLWTAMFGMLFGCGTPERTAPMPKRKTPLPEATTRTIVNSETSSSQPAGETSLKALLRTPVILRHETPGALRWVRDLDGPITAIRWSPLKGFSVSAGKEVHNLTSRGEHRWRVVAGADHKLFGWDDIEAVWSPEFGRITELRRQGIIGWFRDIAGRIVEDDIGTVYRFDASSVAVIAEDGNDRWRVSLENVRRIDGPFLCGDGLLVHGMSGLKRVAVHITRRGNVVTTTPLGRGALLLGAGDNCEPLAWRDGVLSLMNQRGIPRWKRNYAEAPFVQRLPEGFAVIQSRAGLSSHLEVIDMWGKTVVRSDLPVAGRLTKATVFPRGGLGIDAIGLCLDVTNPCARPQDTRGPFNAVVSDDGKGGFRTLVRHTVGHIGLARLGDDDIIMASSRDEFNVDVSLRDRSQTVVWQLTLPGRLSAGPYVGPYGGVYLGTCRGWKCEPPFRLYAITATKPEDEEDESQSATPD